MVKYLAFDTNDKLIWVLADLRKRFSFELGTWIGWNSTRSISTSPKGIRFVTIKSPNVWCLGGIFWVLSADERNPNSFLRTNLMTGEEISMPHGFPKMAFDMLVPFETTDTAPYGNFEEQFKNYVSAQK